MLKITKSEHYLMEQSNRKLTLMYTQCNCKEDEKQIQTKSHKVESTIIHPNGQSIEMNQ